MPSPENPSPHDGPIFFHLSPHNIPCLPLIRLPYMIAVYLVNQFSICIFSQQYSHTCKVSDNSICLEKTKTKRNK
jgi:hypothetical protein